LSEKAKLGAILVAAGLIDEFQLESALGKQARWGNRLGEALVRLGYVTEEDLVRTVSRNYGIPGVHLEGKQIEPEVLALLPVELAQAYRCIPLFTKRVGGGEILYLGMAQPEDLRIVDDVSFRAGLPVRPVLVGPIQIGTAIDAFYRCGDTRPMLDDDVPSTLAETPVSDGDTAPVLSQLQEWVSEPLGDAESGEDGERGNAAIRGVEAEAEAAPLPDSVEKPRDVPTREILHALTQLLIEKGVVSREEVMDRVAINKNRSAR
jgi:type IV pilus assembly protein PilB